MQDAPVPPASPSPAVAETPPPSVPVAKVVLSGLALLKIIKHATDMLPELCVGNLVGASFPSLSKLTPLHSH